MKVKKFNWFDFLNIGYFLGVFFLTCYCLTLLWMAVIPHYLNAYNPFLFGLFDGLIALIILQNVGLKDYLEIRKMDKINNELAEVMAELKVKVEKMKETYKDKL